MNKQEKFDLIYKKIKDENIFDMEKYRNDVQIQSGQKIEFFLSILVFFVSSIIIMAIIMVVLKLLDMDYGIIAIIFVVFDLIAFVSIFKICMMWIKKIGPPKARQYRDHFKSKIIKTLIKSFDTSLEYQPQNFMPQSVYEKAEFDTFTWYWSEDMVCGNISNNCKLTMAEVHTSVTTKENSVTIFEGLFTEIKTPKPFNECIYIRQNNKKVKFNNLKIQLDSKEFEDIFDVYSSNKIVAMQLLTSDVMQKLIEFYNETNILYEITIKDNYIYIEFYCGKLFEVPNIEQFSLDKVNLYKYYEILDFTFQLSNMLVNLINDTQY